ncbi:hypothetical protein [Azospirillum sp. TSO5]|uniref:hypothetical protein n=1 Tax=Azospirillum sp. TSO5 TaxID=716760 RepID=UPI0011B212C1|nr:hypothetical protein [Azospirillum sp. TSO5]
MSEDHTPTPGALRVCLERRLDAKRMAGGKAAKAAFMSELATVAEFRAKGLAWEEIAAGLKEAGIIPPDTKTARVTKWFCEAQHEAQPGTLAPCEQQAAAAAPVQVPAAAPEPPPPPAEVKAPSAAVVETVPGPTPANEAGPAPAEGEKRRPKIGRIM